MKRTLVVLSAVLALALGYPSATSANKPDSPGQSQERGGSTEPCKKKGCGQPQGQSCKNPNPHKTWCGDDDDD